MKLTGAQLNKAILQTLEQHPKANPQQVAQHILKNSPSNTQLDPQEVALQMDRISESWQFLNGLPEKHRPTPKMPTLNLSQSAMFVAHTKPKPKPTVQSNGWSTKEALQNALHRVFVTDKSATVKRGFEGDVTLHPPAPNVTSVSLYHLAGTHQSCALVFSDGKHTVEETAQQLIKNPQSITQLPPITVFFSSVPGKPNASPQLWSMNNRRVKAMQIAQRELAKQGKSLPKIPIQWAGSKDLEYAISPGKFNNTAHGEVQFTQSRDNQQRVQRHLASSSRSQTKQQIQQMEMALKKGEEIDYAAMFDL